jgi:hypothetical protein
MSLKPLPERQFHVQDQGIWEEKQAVVDAWELPSRALTELDLNRKGPVIPTPQTHAAFEGRADVLKRYHVGFGWQADDARSGRWIPQGLTGNADSRDAGNGSRRWLAVSWHKEVNGVEKGTRMSFVDVTNWGDPVRYRNVLLVNPVAAADGPSRHASFAAIPAHAGGAVWFRDYLYVADSRGYDEGTPGGVLVFDMTQIKEVDDSRDDLIGWSPDDNAYYAIGYRYVLPQVGRYVQLANGGDERLRWSFIGLDRTGSKRSLMMGEYKTSDQAPGRLTWWDLDERTGRLAAGGPARRLAASLARVCSDERFLQGGHSSNALTGGTVWLSSSSDRDALCERPVSGGKGATHEPWADQPEGLTYAPASDNLWCVTERAGARAVFAVKRKSL